LNGTKGGNKSQDNNGTKGNNNGTKGDNNTKGNNGNKGSNGPKDGPPPSRRLNEVLLKDLEMPIEQVEESFADMATQRASKVKSLLAKIKPFF
jgi:hypothetical protein